MSEKLLATFETLLEGIEAEIADCSEEGSAFFITRDLEGVKESLERVRKIIEFRNKVVDLQKEANDLWPFSVDGKLERGLRTPESAYRRPILEALVAMGGSGTCAQILERVQESMKGTLKDVDYDWLTADVPRWYNAAQWCRNLLVKEGLMKKNSPRGTWEIDDAGRLFLKQ